MIRSQKSNAFLFCVHCNCRFVTHVIGIFHCNNRVCISIGSCTSAADVQVDDHRIVRKREDARESQARATDIQVHSKHILSILRTYL